MLKKLYLIIVYLIQIAYKKLLKNIKPLVTKIVNKLLKQNHYSILKNINCIYENLFKTPKPLNWKPFIITYNKYYI